MDKLTFSFDIGYASIGWAALKAAPQVEVLGTGVVLFPKDDCLASQRRMYRRMRRTIRSRRQRIDRMGRILVHHGVITVEECLLPGHPAPFWLAARALAGKMTLSGLDVWHLMRWYAHNRGYDGNSLWSGSPVAQTDDEEDTAKVEAAKANMKKLGTNTMAETVTKLLGLELEGNKSSMKAYKTLDMAFPRKLVRAEVERILTLHANLPAHVTQLIIGDADGQRDELAACGVRLPRRFSGSVMFGQLVPRFDNRIIARCPITWAHEYKKALEAGLGDKAARAQANKYAKVPKADCREFYEYRFARILCNIRAEGKPLSAELRVKLMEQAREVGRFTATSFIKAVKGLIGDAPNNLYNFFQIHPDSDAALSVNPEKGGTVASGRAPYARPVLRQVVEEVLRGEDPTKAAFSLVHPEGEHKAQDGVLYCLSDPESEVSRLQATRRVEDMSNNHLVRHRMLIFKRLLRDMIRKYAKGDTSRVGQFCIEVGRELSEFSGKSSEEIAKLLGIRMKHFKDAVSKLKNEAPHLALTAGLIRKCRIAMDMGMTCPYTGQKYGVDKLPDMEKEHIIPHASRNSNSLSSLVLTWSQVNQMKGKRTALQFVREEAGNPVPGMDNYHIVTVNRYKEFVASLPPRGDTVALERKLRAGKVVNADDFKRRLKRKKLMLVDAPEPGSGKENNLGFTEGMMTQSSHLMKIAQHVAKGLCPKAKMTMIPGAVTAAVRASWKTWGLLGKVCPEVIDREQGKPRLKEDIRGITHLHHAVDACVLGLIPLLIPAGTNDIVWHAMGMRKLSEKDAGQLREVIWGNMLQIDDERRIHLRTLPAAVRESFIRALQEERVMTHVPADMSGAKLEKTTWRVLKVENGVAHLQQRGCTTENGKRCFVVKKGDKYNKSTGMLVGVTPGGKSKLKENKGARIIDKNYGVALIGEPVVIPHQSVYKRLSDLRKRYGRIKVLRKGQLIRVMGYKDETRNRLWQIMGVKVVGKGAAALDLQKPAASGDYKAKHVDNWRDVRVKSLMKCGMKIVPRNYTGEETD